MSTVYRKIKEMGASINPYFKESNVIKNHNEILKKISKRNKKFTKNSSHCKKNV